MKTISELKEETTAIKEGWKKERKQHDWFGLVFCREWCSVSDVNSKPIWLGKTEEIIPYYKSRGFNGENVAIAIQLAKDYSEDLENKALKSPESHLRSEKQGGRVKICPPLHKVRNAKVSNMQKKG